MRNRPSHVFIAIILGLCLAVVALILASRGVSALYSFVMEYGPWH